MSMASHAWQRELSKHNCIVYDPDHTAGHAFQDREESIEVPVTGNLRPTTAQPDGGGGGGLRLIVAGMDGGLPSAGCPAHVLTSYSVRPPFDADLRGLSHSSRLSPKTRVFAEF
jgi:hypothetical protein